MSTVQLGSTCLWSASLSSDDTAYIHYCFFLSSISSFLLFFKQAYPDQDIQESQPGSRPEILTQTSGRGTGKRHACQEIPSSQPWWSYRYLHIQTVIWDWRLLYSFGFGQPHFMPNCNRTSNLHLDPLCNTSGICFNFCWHCCSGCWQHSAVTLLNINATSIKAWRKSMMPTNGGV